MGAAGELTGRAFALCVVTEEERARDVPMAVYVTALEKELRGMTGVDEVCGFVVVAVRGGGLREVRDRVRGALEGASVGG